MKCNLLGCNKERKESCENQYCCVEHGIIDRSRYVGETLQEYIIRLKELRLRRKNI